MQKCACGCEAFTGIATYTNRKLGIIEGQPLQYIRGHNRRGQKFPGLGKGRRLSEETKQKIGEKARGREISDEARQNMSIAAKERWSDGMPVEHRQKISKSMKGYKRTKEHQDNLVRSLTGREPIYSPFVPDLRVFYIDDKTGGRWYCTKRPADGKRDQKITHARAVWEHFNGPVPNGESKNPRTLSQWRVHHKDGKTRNLEDDRPNNLLLTPDYWNLYLFPALQIGLHVSAEIVTKAYESLVGKVPDDNLFREVCRLLLQEYPQ